MTTLLGDLTKVAKYVKDPRLAQILKDKDKDKQGEHGGIGTPATRSAIIDNLFKRNYLQEKGKSIVSTDKGKALYDKLDDLIRYPDMTAVWHEQQKGIKNQNDVDDFIKQMMANTINPIIEHLQLNYTKPTPKQKPSAPCPKCGRAMYLNDGKFGKYWGCSGYKDQQNPCKHTMNDKDGVPVEKEPKPVQNLSAFDCQKCGSKLTKFNGVSKKTGKPYTKFNCSSFPKCKQSYWEKDGKPDYGE